MINIWITKAGLYIVLILYAALCSTVCAEPAPISQHYINAERAVKKGDEKKAELELKLALQADPLDAKAHYLLGTLLARKGDEEQALVGFQRTIMIDPTQPEALHNLGTLLLRRGQAAAAVELLEMAVVYKPDYIPPYNSLAKAYFSIGLPELAMATYKEVLSRDPGNKVAAENFEMLSAAARLIAEGREKVETDNTGDSPSSGDMEKTVPDAPDQPQTDKEKSPPPKEKTSPASATPSPETFRDMLNELPYIDVKRHEDTLALTGWTRSARERSIIDRILTRWPDILDLTGVDSGDPMRMLEVDVTLFIVISIDTTTAGFNFLQQISLNSTVFSSQNLEDGPWTGLDPGALKLPAWGAFTVASIDYDVNIANAVEEQVAVLARPHLTTLSGTAASFLAGGEFVFKVSGLETGDIKPYPFGTSVDVTPTLLRTPGEDGTPRIHLKVRAERKSVLEFLTAQGDDDGSIVFDKLTVDGQAILDLNQTLILSGLNQREARTSRSGVPYLKSIPVIKYLFSQKVTAETDTAIIILLTPRDPAFDDENNRRELSEFVQMRRDYAKAKQGSGEDLRAFRKRYPDWQDMPPNRFASHFFLAETSEMYRSVSGEDLIDENLDLHLLRSHVKKKEY